MPASSIPDLQFVKEVGPRRFEVLQEAGIQTAEDLLQLYPRRYIDFSGVIPINRLPGDGELVTIIGRVTGTSRFRGRRGNVFKVTIEDDTGTAELTWFRNIHFFEHAYQKDDYLMATGKPGWFRGWSLTHPRVEKIVDPGEQQNIGERPLPVYPGTESFNKVGLTSSRIGRIVGRILDEVNGNLPELFPRSLLDQYELMEYNRALNAVHRPQSNEELLGGRHRLVFQEFFFLELMMALRRHQVREVETGIAFGEDCTLEDQLRKALPFQLTPDQEEVLEEIRADMIVRRPMNRLLEGDVGSGKTLVALLAMLRAVESGYQAALMVPTEILAMQHFRTINKLAEPLSLNIVLITGGGGEGLRRERLLSVAEGRAQIVVGTHALFQKQVRFQNLGFVVIDEQHRFGVLQRGLLRDKGVRPDTLVMSATPIPRTLALTVYGDLDISVIRNLPPGRRPIETVWRRDNKVPAIMKFVREQVEQGDQAYIVFPLVEESDKMDLRDATGSEEEMSQRYFRGIRSGLIHGRLSSEEKDAVMESFNRGDIRVLFSTTVVEVGVDNPNATLMVIMNAERFGLSQLHQLRGRVGRGDKQSWCILVASGQLGEEGEARLSAMVNFSDGFRIAEADLKLRGSGDFFGTRQHGMPALKIANLFEDQQILQEARHAAFRVIAEDPLLLNYPEIRDHFQTYYEDKFQRVDD